MGGIGIMRTEQKHRAEPQTLAAPDLHESKPEQV